MKKGVAFTLIELLIVIAIIGILAGLMLLAQTAEEPSQIERASTVEDSSSLCSKRPKKSGTASNEKSGPGVPKFPSRHLVIPFQMSPPFPL